MDAADVGRVFDKTNLSVIQNLHLTTRKAISSLKLGTIVSSPSVQSSRTQERPAHDTLSRRLYYKLNAHSKQLVCCGSRIFHKYQSVMDTPDGVFRGSLDRFNGITVESSVEFEPNVDFPEKLKKSLEYWSRNKRRGIWFKVSTEHSTWIPHLCKEKFDFHHAKSGFAVMHRWLPTDEYANIPSFAHTLIGVGGLVVNEQDEILVVSDRYALIPGSWKLPGGYVEAHENLVDAAIREVREETGIEGKFKSVVCIRHSHRGGFNCSDMYFVVALTTESHEVKRCEREIAQVQWMPIKEYLSHPNVHETNRHFVRTFLDYRQRGIYFTCEKAKHQILQIDYSLYYMKKQDEGEAKNESSTK